MLADQFGFGRSMGGMAACTVRLLYRIAPMGLAELRVLQVMTLPAELPHRAHQHVRLRGGMGIMTGLAVLDRRDMHLPLGKQRWLMTGEAEGISRLFEQSFLLCGMRIMTAGTAHPLPACIDKGGMGLALGKTCLLLLMAGIAEPGTVLGQDNSSYQACL